MDKNFIKPYEISVWEDKLIIEYEQLPANSQEEPEIINSYYKEVKIAVIGSNSMKGYNAIYEPVFTKKTNGEKTLTFSLKYQYFDPYIGATVVNPFASYLINERKVKLYYDNKWYDFIIKEHSESSDGLVWTYTATDAFVNELSKNGYSKEFDVELGNNQGTAIELAKAVVEGTDWTIDEENSSVGPQEISEAIYNAQIVSNDVTIVNAETGEDIGGFSNNTPIYLFYNYVANKDGQYVQFILQEENPNNYVLDDNNTIKATNYRITTPLVYDEAHSRFVLTDDPINLTNATPVITFTTIEVSYQAYRQVYGQLSTYEPVVGRTVKRYKVEGLKPEIYSYTDFIYSTSDIVTNYISNGENFNTFENGTLQGWQERVQTTVVDSESKPVFGTVQLVTYPAIEPFSTLSSLISHTQIEGYMEVKFPASFSAYQNGIFNSGIEDNAYSIDTIAAGQEYVFRWRGATSDTQHGNLSAMNGNELRVVVAKYKKSTDDTIDYYNIVDQNNIILDFNSNGQVLNNYITGGIFGTNHKNYQLDGITQEPSTKYIYQADGPDYVWDSSQLKYVEKDNSNFLDYHYMTATAKRSVTATELADSTQNFGIFIYLKNNANANYWYYLQDIQLTKLYRDGEDKIITIGNAPVAVATPIDYYYIAPKTNAKKEEIEIYTSIEALASTLGTNKDLIKPIYNENSTKYLSINESHSNCYNLLQTIAETFECWVDIVVNHNEKGEIIYSYRKTLDTKINEVKTYYTRSGAGTTQDPYVYTRVLQPTLINISTYYEYKPEKFIHLRDYAGKDNFAGFKYGINLDTIERTINSDEIVTKLVVLTAQSEYTDTGSVAISYASANPSGEEYILNFDYYYKQGLITNVEDAKGDIIKFNSLLKDINSHLATEEKEKEHLEASLVQLNSQRNYYSTAIEQAANNVNDGREDFKLLTGHDYNDYRGDKTGTQIVDLCYFLTKDTQVHQYKDYFIRSGHTYTLVENPQSNPKNAGYYEYLPNLEDNNNLKNLIGKIYSNSYVINNYTGILTNIEKEYKQTRANLYGSEEFTVTVGTYRNSNNQYNIKVNVSEYIQGFNFYLASDPTTKYKTSVNQKTFEFTLLNLSPIIIDSIPNGYKLFDSKNIEIGTIVLTTDKIQTFTLKPNTVFDGVEDRINHLIEQKEKLVELFYNKYSRFIQEGTWSSTDYIDSNLYYLDALQVSNTSAQPQVSYSIKVVEISGLDDFELYKFDTGDKTYIEDIEFFGWSEIGGITTPAREEVIVSEVEWHLEEPENNIITVQNYKTRFEDLFQRISATVQTVQYNEATYAKTSSLMDAYGTISQNVLLASLNNISGQRYTLTSDGSIQINGDCISIIDIKNPNNQMQLRSTGLCITSDGGKTWATAIDGNGINLGTVRSSMLNTDTIIIGSKENPSFRWDKYGISAYKRDAATNEYSLNTYVRFDQYGLYGVKSDYTGFVAANLDDVKKKANFGITWDGFFIKNSYKGGGVVSLSSDNDFRITMNSGGQEIEKIKIGALEWEDVNHVIYTDPATLPPGINQPSKYGIRINNNNGVPVFKTGDDGNLEITGKLNATAGDFSGIVRVGPENQEHIIIDGIDASIRTSGYSDGASYGWMIDKLGNAVFNNITARGAIKTAVFEYAEIQAVGGIYIFRPSSTIRTAIVKGNDLLVTVEKPEVFKEGDYCKVSNYIQHGQDANPDIDNILLNNGLTHVYEISISETYIGEDSVFVLGESVLGENTLGDSDKVVEVITLIGGAEMVVGENKVTTLTDLVGGALVDMGNKQGTNNYGIGINSSDNTVNLPRRAISLFETSINENIEPKVTYQYRGILGTLPKQSVLNVDYNIYKNMEDTQGIFTDNMYIGDASQFIAFYTDKRTNPNYPQRKLVIRASELYFESNGESRSVADIEKESGPKGIPGNNALQISVLSTFGTSIRQGSGYGALYVRVTKDGVELDPIGDNVQAVTVLPSESTSSGYCVLVNQNSNPRTATIYKWNEDLNEWEIPQPDPNVSVSYRWSFKDVNNENISAADLGVTNNTKCVFIDSSVINRRLVAEVEVVTNITDPSDEPDEGEENGSGT